MGIKGLSKGSPILFLIPICAIAILITIFVSPQRKAEEIELDTIILTASFVPLGIMILHYLYARSKADLPVEIFTVWFLLNILGFACSAGGIFYDRANQGNYKTDFY